MTDILEAKADQIPEFSDLLKKHKKSILLRPHMTIFGHLDWTKRPPSTLVHLLGREQTSLALSCLKLLGAYVALRVVLTLLAD